MGQVIGAVLAESVAIAEKAAKLVAVRYEELPPVMTIEDAIAADRYDLMGTPRLVLWDVEGRRLLPVFNLEISSGCRRSLCFFARSP